MVFRVFLASILLLGQVRSIAQIENLTTTNEVVRFVQKVAKDLPALKPQPYFRMIPQTSADSLIKTYQMKDMEKVDLDERPIWTFGSSTTVPV